MAGMRIRHRAHRARNVTCKTWCATRDLSFAICRLRDCHASQATAELVANDPQEQFARQAARIKADEEHTAKVDEVREAMAAAENAYSQIPTSNEQARERAMDRILSLRLQLGKLQTVTEAV